MRNRLLISLLVLLAIPAICLAADSSRAAAVSGKIDQIVAIGDGSSGYLAEISSSSGALNVSQRAQAVSMEIGDGLVYTGACRIISITVSGASTGDYAAVYDAITATGTPKFDPSIAANTSSFYQNCGGAPFATGIYVKATDDDVYTSIVYDY
jgi:hypothetical protein